MERCASGEPANGKSIVGLLTLAAAKGVTLILRTEGDDEVEAFAKGPVTLAVTHPNYAHDLELNEDTRSELLADLRGGT